MSPKELIYYCLVRVISSVVLANHLIEQGYKVSVLTGYQVLKLMIISEMQKL